MRTKLTKSIVESPVLQRPREVYLWDNQIPGFGVRVYPSGRRVYLYQYRTKGGRTRKLKLGAHGSITCEQARKSAQQYAADVARGEDPAGNVQALRSAPTMSELCDRYMSEHAKVANNKKPKSIEGDQALIDRKIKPKLGSLKVVDVTRADIKALHHGLHKTPYQANRLRALLSKMFNLAELWNLRPQHSNPCVGVTPYQEEKRKRYLSNEEICSLIDALNSAETSGEETSYAVGAIKLLLFTGARKNEILTLQWDWVDLELGVINLQDRKTGPLTILLNPQAIDVLVKLPRVDGNPHVFVGKNEGAHLYDLKGPWRRIKESADIVDCRLHDLRHTFASVAVSSGLSLPMIGALLGHSQPQTTQRYAHLMDSSVREASAAVGGLIAGE